MDNIDVKKMHKKRKSLYRHETLIPNTLLGRSKPQCLPPIFRSQSDTETNTARIIKTTAKKEHSYPTIKLNNDSRTSLKSRNRKMDTWMSPMMSPMSVHKFKGTNTRPSTKDTPEQRTPVVSRQPTAGVPGLWTTTGVTCNPSSSLDSPIQTTSRLTTNINLSKDSFSFIIRPGFDVSWVGCYTLWNIM